VVCYRKILLTTDFSECSKAAIPHAVALARKSDAELVVLHVLEPLLTPLDVTWGPVAQLEDWEAQRADYSRKYLDEWAHSELPSDLTVNTLLIHGTPIRGILRTVSDLDIDLVVMATHGQTGIAHALFGSTSEKVVSRCPVPVLTVRVMEDNAG